MTTSLLLHCDGAHGAGAPTLDATGKTVTVAGTALLSTTQSKFGGASLALNGTTQYLTAADCPDFDFGSGDFTVEAWVYTTSLAALQVIACKRSSATFGPFQIAIAATTGVVSGYVSTTGSSWTYSVAGSALSVNTWTHIALVRSGSTLQMYVGGVAAASPATMSGAVTTNTIAASFGATSDGTAFFVGYIDEPRITKGQAIYTAGFAPPTAPFGIAGDDPYWGNVVLAMHMDGANAGTTFTELKGKTTTVTNTTTSTTQSKFGGASGSFNGTTSLISVPYSSDFDFGTGDFTIEAWVYTTSLATSQEICAKRAAANSNGFWFLRINTSGTVRIYNVSATVNTTDIATTSATVAINGWHHIAACRSGGTYYIFIDGVSAALTTTANTGGAWNTEAIATIIGAGTDSPSSVLSGYLDDLRVTKGVARYTATFTPLTDSWAVVSGDPYYNNVVLGLHMDGANAGTAFVDTAGKTVTATNATTSTTQSKFGSTSASFTGSASYLTVPNSSDFDFGSGDFCIEFFVRPTTVAALKGFIAKRTSNATFAPFVIYMDATSHVVAMSSFNGTTYGVTITSAATLTAATWYHIAYTRSGNVFTLYIDGTSTGTPVTQSGALTTNTDVVVIGSADTGGSLQFDGFIDDLRITKGSARY